MNTLILGIGNLLWADEGFGIRCVEALDARYHFKDGDNVEIMDGGTQGIYLVHHVQDADNLIVFDAIDYGLEPSEIKVIKGDAVPNFMGAKKISLHQTGFQEVLSTARLMDSYPSNIVLIGVQPELIEDFGGSLHPKVSAQIDPCIQIALNTLAEWGIEAIPREVISETLVQPELNRHVYETQRPSESEANRMGDDRILSSNQFTLRDKPLHEGISNIKSVPIDSRKLFED